MTFFRLLVLGCSLIVPSLLACSTAPGQSELQVVEKVGEQFRLQIFDNSQTFSQGIGINAAGEILGLRELADETGSIFRQQNFFVTGGKSVEPPMLDGFTNVEFKAVSDTGLIVGYASRPMGHPDGSLTALLWNSKTGKLTNLGAAEGDTASQAQDISADGRRIVGYTTGPARLRPCIWTWNEETDHWDAEALPVILDNNPYLMTSAAVISPDGKRIAGCISVAMLGFNDYDSSLFVWEQVNGDWQHKLVSDEQMYLKDINNAGEIVGAITIKSQRKPFHISKEGKLTLITLLDGDETGEAQGINEQGLVVGFSDDPPGPVGGPQAILWKDGKTTALELPAGTTYSAAYGINAKGQITGLLDLEFPNNEQAAPAEGDDDESVGATLAFRWTAID